MTEISSGGANPRPRATPPKSAEDGHAPPPWLDRAILIYGPRKGGTTLFLNLLDGTPELFIYPAELKLKYFVKADWGHTDDAERYRAFSRIPTLKSPRLDLDSYQENWRGFTDGATTPTLKELIGHDVAQVLESVSTAPASPKLWCAKEVGGRTSHILALWFALFDQPKALLLLRDPLMVVRAILNDRRRQRKRLSLRAIARETRDSLRVVKAQSRYLDDPRTLTICYEDLVADTVAEMRRVCAFIGVPYSERFTRPSLLGEVVVVATSSRQTTKVFMQESDWSDGLPLRERLTVRFAKALFGLLPRYRIDYRELRRRVAEKRREESA